MFPFTPAAVLLALVLLPLAAAEPIVTGGTNGDDDTDCVKIDRDGESGTPGASPTSGPGYGAALRTGTEEIIVRVIPEECDPSPGGLANLVFTQASHPLQGP